MIAELVTRWWIVPVAYFVDLRDDMLGDGSVLARKYCYGESSVSEWRPSELHLAAGGPKWLHADDDKRTTKGS
jgi:hypothetical protein